MRRAVAVIAVAAATVIVVAVAADDGAPGPAPAAAPLPAAVAAGHAWELATAAGPIHVWAPAGYHPDGAAVVLYVHGYDTDVDAAWRDHRLPEQFALAAVNAVFIAAEAPAGSRQAVRWPALEDLLAEVFAAIDLPRPTGALIAIGHSGAYRTLLAWTAAPALDWIISLDATYGEVDAWRGWMAASAAHHLIFVGDDTVRWTEELARGLAEDLGAGAVVTVDDLAELDDELGPARADARAIYLRTGVGHMPLVTAGRAIPRLLRLAPVEVLADAPWRAPLGLPPLALDAGAAP
ncbi:MAG: hypothetical protein IPH44_02005 [Myxococcales bacterium]|nr:hypothetical protein [Myxococcales bacterium]MBK7198091.1 hypothetical protein [Myxococcales bacterium]MBP6846601.1 hypothetical protein [Kofleriaceae bacterium]